MGWLLMLGGLIGAEASAGAGADPSAESVRSEIDRLIGLVETDPVVARALALSLLESPEAVDPAIEAELRIQLAALAREQGDLSRARQEADRAHDLAQAGDDSRLLASALNELVGVALGAGRIEDALQLAEECLRLRRLLGDEAEIARTLNNIGLIHSQTGQYATALAYYLESLRIKEAAGDDHSAASTLNNLAIVRFEMGDYEASVADLERARAIFEQAGNRTGLADVLDNLGRAKREQGALDEALKLHLASLELERQLGRPEGIAVSLGHAGLVYNRLGQHEQALRFSEDALAINRTLNLPRGLAFSLLNLGIARFGLGDLEGASAALDEGIDQALRMGDRGLLRDLYANLSEVQAEQGLFAEAYAASAEARRIEQLIFNREIGRRMAELESAYRIDQKDREIEMLRMERELHELTIERGDQQIAFLAQKNRVNRLSRNSLIGAFVALSVCLVILHSRYRLKRGIEKALREKNAESIRQKEMVEAQGRKIGEANRELHLTNMKLRELSRAVEQSPTGVLITDRAGAITYVNPRFTEVTGFSLDDVRGANPRIFQSGRHGRDFYKLLWGTILTGRVWRGRFINRRRDGSLYEEEATISPVINEVGEIFNFVAVMEFHPAGPVTEASEPADDADSVVETESSLKALALVDLQVNRKVVKVLLESLDCGVTFVRDENELEEAVGSGCYDFLLLDPDSRRRSLSNLIALVRRAEGGGSLPIVGIDDGESEPEASREVAGAVFTLARPINREGLRAAIGRCSGQPPEGEATGKPSLAGAAATRIRNGFDDGGRLK